MTGQSVLEREKREFLTDAVEPKKRFVQVGRPVGGPYKTSSLLGLESTRAKFSIGNSGNGIHVSLKKVLNDR